MFSADSKPTVSKAVLALRAYLAKAPQAELDERLARVKAMNLPQTPTVSEVVAQQALTRHAEVSSSRAYYTGREQACDISTDAYSFATAA